MVSWKVQRKRLDLQSPGSSSLLWGGAVTLHILRQGHNSLLHTSAPVPVL